MSDSESSSSSDTEDVAVTGLVATRARRSNAGAAIASILANEELREAVLEGVEDDAESYAGSEKDAVDDDEAMDSSSDDEDAGPPKEGEAEEMVGERELKRMERVEQRKKRKAADARLKLPTWQRKIKRVKMADDAKREDGSSTPVDQQLRPKKKSERANWLPSAADAPTRQSARASAVQNRETIHANLKQSAERSEKQKKVMKHAVEREDAKKRRELSQDERLEKCRKIEKETSRELGRWEREEAERQRIREEILAAKRKRHQEGPVIRHWSGSGIYEGYDQHWKLKVKRVLPAKKVEDIENTVSEKDGEDGLKEDAMNIDHKVTDVYDPSDPPPSVAAHTITYTEPPIIEPPKPEPPIEVHELPPRRIDSSPPTGFLEGLEAYAFQPDATQGSPVHGASLSNADTSAHPPTIQPFHYPPPIPQQAYQRSNLLQSNQQQPPHVYHGWPPGASMFNSNTAAKGGTSNAQTKQPLPPQPPLPTLREQAQRSLLILQNFTNLSLPQQTPTGRPKKRQDPTAGDITAIRNVLLPDTLPVLTPEQHRYLFPSTMKRNSKLANVPQVPKARCAVTSWSGKYRDPKTGLAFADVHAYKVIQRLIAGGMQWSSLLGAWTGTSYGTMGRAARGVPDGFSSRLKTSEVSTGVKKAVKAEEANV